MNLLEFVLAISLISLGSNHTFFLPHRITEAASRFWSFNELQLQKEQISWLIFHISTKNVLHQKNASKKMWEYLRIEVMFGAYLYLFLQKTST